jgi:hypothetical protein
MKLISVLNYCIDKNVKGQITSEKWANCFQTFDQISLIFLGNLTSRKCPNIFKKWAAFSQKWESESGSTALNYCFLFAVAIHFVRMSLESWNDGKSLMAFIKQTYLT